MRIGLLLLLFLIAASPPGVAKDDFMLAFSVEGKAKFKKSDSSKSKRLKSKTLLFPEASIKLKKNAQVNLYYDGEYQIVKGPGVFKISQLMTETQNRVKDRFAKMMAEDYLMASTGGKGTGKEKGGIGWGNEKFYVIPITPASDSKDPVKLDAGQIKFEWKNKEGVAPSNNTFQFMIKGRGQREVHSQEVKGFSLTLNASALSLEPGQTYGWSVQSVKNDTINSRVVLFEFTESTEKQAVLEEIRRRPIYKSSSPATQLFFEAVYLEENDFHYAAYRRYVEGVKRYKKNPMLREGHRDYLIRHDVRPSGD